MSVAVASVSSRQSSMMLMYLRRAISLDTGVQSVDELPGLLWKVHLGGLVFAQGAGS